MKSSRTQTTFSFNTQRAADLFVAWLRRNVSDQDFGAPALVSEIKSGEFEWSVEYVVDRGAHYTFVKGIATGLEMACQVEGVNKTC